MSGIAAAVRRLVAPAVAALVAWAASFGVQLPPEFSHHIEEALLLAIMAIVTAVVEVAKDRLSRRDGQ